MLRMEFPISNESFCGDQKRIVEKEGNKPDCKHHFVEIERNYEAKRMYLECKHCGRVDSFPTRILLNFNEGKKKERWHKINI